MSEMVQVVAITPV